MLLFPIFNFFWIKVKIILYIDILNKASLTLINLLALRHWTNSIHRMSASLEFNIINVVVFQSWLFLVWFQISFILHSIVIWVRGDKFKAHLSSYICAACIKILGSSVIKLVQLDFLAIWHIYALTRYWVRGL